MSVVSGLIGMFCAGNAKKAGFDGGLRTAGLVLSVVGLIGGAIAFIACVACIGAVGSLGF